MPTANVRELACKFAHGLRIVRANDRLDPDRDMTSTGVVHVGTDSVGKFKEGNEVFDAFVPVQDGGDKFAGDPTVFDSDGTVPLGLPIGTKEGWCIDCVGGTGDVSSGYWSPNVVSRTI